MNLSFESIHSPYFSIMRKVYYLSTCSTCKRIMDELGSHIDSFEMQDIKTEPVNEDQVEAMKALSGDYESLFSRRSMKYKSMGLANQSLDEEDFKRLILEEYTFLKRPVFILDDEIFIGNSPKTIEQLKSRLS